MAPLNKSKTRGFHSIPFQFFAQCVYLINRGKEREARGTKREG